MNYQFSSSQKNCQCAITPEQLNQIIEAIADGRYSWACVLILRFIGYNPLHYIPQRTYSRLIKENSQIVAAASASSKQQMQTNLTTSGSCSSRGTSAQVLTKV
ncbi:MAG TPA: HetP family heterocyst commitment protein [Nostocaceae cyanobacterium]|nr:HetP family heterocyst commitment protein [Nostocaceae cyanobacterium]